MADWPDEYDQPDEGELIIVCPDDMCRGQFDGEGPPCGRWQDSCVRWKPALSSGADAAQDLKGKE